MKTQLMLFGLALMTAIPTAAASKSFPIRNKLTVITDGVSRTHWETRSHDFQIKVIGDRSGTKTETWKNGQPFITAEKNERYAVQLYNPLPVRVAVNLTVDGLNSLTGEPCGLSDGRKWIIEPYATITIRGWQVNGSESRRFFFTDTPKSYAQWQGENLNRDLSANCGVIGAAYFWNKKELQDYYEKNRNRKGRTPPPWVRRESMANNLPQESKPQEAGTGMGEREAHAVEMVRFDFNTGMYRASQAVVLYYDFAALKRPNPFPEARYAPEMPY